jgi:hypothetical protein
MGKLFLLGAGFSKAVSNHMPVLAEFPELLAEIKSVQHLFGEKSAYPQTLQANFELFLTYLSQPKPWLSEAQNLRNRAAFLELSQAVATLLRDQANKSFDEIGREPRWLAALINHWNGEPCTVISFNYDTLIETVASKFIVGTVTKSLSGLYPIPLTPANLRVAGVWAGEKSLSFKLLKLHGSINWYYSGSSDFAGEPLYVIEPRGGISGRHEHEQKDYEAYESVYDKVPLIVPPTLEKQMIHQHESLRRLWSLADEALRRATKIVCIGYSLPESDLTIQFLLQEKRSEPVTFEIVDLEDKTGHFKKLLPSHFKVEQHFSGPTAVRDFCKPYSGEE